MQKIVLLLATIVIAINASGQKRSYPIEWEESPKLHSIPDSLKKESAVFVLDQRRLEFKAGDNRTFYVYRTTHRIIHILDDRGAESFNKFTQPVSTSSKIVSMKARSISPSGKVVESGDEKVKKIKNEQGYPEYLLAVEGVEKGGEVEIISVEKRPLTLFGSENMQFSLPIMKAEFSMMMPYLLKFNTKGYNGFPNAKESLIGETRSYTVSQTGIPALEEEEYSNYKSNLRHFDYKLSFIDYQPDTRRLTWDDLVKELNTKYLLFTDRERRAAKRFLDDIGIAQGDDEVQKIQKIEDYMKMNISISNSLKDNKESEEFSTIVDKKVTTEDGFTRLFCACLDAAGVRYEPGLTASRYSYIMDDSLELWNEMDEFVLYFPKEKEYLAPSAINFRYPFFPAGFANSKAVFCKLNKETGKETADIKVIPALPIEKSTNTIDANVTFSTGDMTPIIDVTHSFTGYAAVGVREAFLYSPKEKEQENIKQIITLADKPEDIKSYSVKGEAFKNYYNDKPVELNLSVRSPLLMEKAGPKYLFKVGDIIGKQAELYAEKRRVMPVDVQYKHAFVRNINVTIPEGYKVVNPNAVKVKVVQTIGGKEAAGFKSDYTMEGKVMKIRIKEFYDELHMPVTEFDAFRKVINAAADFNKVVLVLQKS